MATVNISVNGAGMSGTVEYYEDTVNTTDNSSRAVVIWRVSKATGYSTTYGDGTPGNRALLKLTVNGVDYWSSTSLYVYAGSTVEVVRATPTIVHSGTGTASVSWSISGGIEGTSWTTSSGSGSFDLTDISRPPYTPNTPTYTTRSSGSTTISNMSTSASVPTSAPSIDYYRWYTYPNPGWTNGGGGWGYTDQAGTWSWSGFNTDTDYTTYAYAHNSEGFSPASSSTVMYAAPRFTGFSFPQGITGKAYSGTISGNNVSSYSVATGSLPPGLSISGSSIVGTPTTPGTYTFTLRATRAGVSTVDSTSQSIQIVAGGPWVKLSSAWLNKTVSNVSVTSNVATITTSAAHGITQLNQPITISGVTGQTWLNADWIVTSIPTTTTFTVAVVRANLASTAISGSVTSVWKRSEVRIITVGGASPSYIQGYMLRNTGSGWNNTA